MSICDENFWRDDSGNPSTPFTMIKKSDVVGKNPKWLARTQSRRWDKVVIEGFGYRKYCFASEEDLQKARTIWPYCPGGQDGFETAMTSNKITWSIWHHVGY